MATIIDLPAFVRGDTWPHKFEFKDAAGAPIDVTGWTLWVTLKLDPTAADAAADAQAAVLVPGGADATNGIAYVVFTPADTEGLLPATYQYDRQYRTPTGEVQTISLGTVEVLADITRSR